jgi:hypothetical protein
LTVLQRLELGPASWSVPVFGIRVFPVFLWHYWHCEDTPRWQVALCHVCLHHVETQNAEVSRPLR